MINNEKKYNINENKIEIKAIKDEVKKLKIEYENELVKYKNASRNIIETEEKFNNISKKINKIKYKQMILTNKITNEYIDNLNNYKLESNIKVTILSLLGFPFPNDEPFYFTSPEDLIAQLSLSKEFLFNLVLTKKYEFDIIKSSYDTLNKNILVLRPIYDYMKLNFDIINWFRIIMVIYFIFSKCSFWYIFFYICLLIFSCTIIFYFIFYFIRINFFNGRCVYNIGIINI